MRQIKFRAWDTIDLKYVDCMRQPFNFLTGYNNKSSSLILEQFTGILDKNGKETYEGDIIKHLFCEHLCVVVFDSGCFVGKEQDHDSYTQPLFPYTVIEVIGNIHENKELLK